MNIENGEKVCRYQLHRRIDRAQALLADTDRSLVDVALKVGFPKGTN